MKKEVHIPGTIPGDLPENGEVTAGGILEKILEKSEWLFVSTANAIFRAI